MTQFRFDPDYQVIIISANPTPNDEDFQLWATLLLHAPAISCADFNAGADRHQMRFHFTDHSFNLNFEHYSESIWISAEGVEAAAHLSELHHYLSEQLQ